MRDKPEIIKMIEDLYCLGIDVFGSIESFISWKAAPNPYCEGLAPSQMLSSKDGYRHVMELLENIARGDLS